MTAVFTLAKRLRQAFTRRNIIICMALLMAVSAGAIFLHTRQSTAAISRDCGPVVNGVANSIANNPNSGGGCGQVTAGEVITDIQNGNPDDQAAIYAAFGLTAADYANFSANAVQGTAFRDGTIRVGNQVVMTDAWSIGRVQFNYATPHSVPGTFRSNNSQVLQSDMPVFILFDENGNVKTAILAPCGNPTTGNQVSANAACKMLNMAPVAGQANTYNFTTDVDKTANVQITKLEYFFDEGSGPQKFAETTNPATVVTKAFTKSATISVQVTVTMPGGASRVLTVIQNCTKRVEVTPPPAVFQMCKALLMTALDESVRKFRFTVITHQSASVVVQSANFSVDGTQVATNITDKNGEGNIIWDRTFDANAHTISTVVNFVVDGKVVQSVETCQVAIPGKPQPPQPPKPPVVPPQSKPPLPQTGAGDLAGLFAGASAAGAIGHQLVIRRRNKR